MTTRPFRTVSRRWRTTAISLAAATGLYVVGFSRGAPAGAVDPSVELYDVRDLLAASVRWSEQTAAGRQMPSSPNCLGFIGNVGSPYQNRQVSTATAEQDAVDELKALLQDNVRPNCWKDNGGEVGEMRCQCGHLLVRLTPEGHRDLAAFLARLRRATTRAAGR